MEEELQRYREVVEEALERTEPMSLRARVFATLLRFAERGERMLESLRAKELPYMQIAIVIEVRDMARKEQQWVTDLLRDESPSAEIEKRLLLYRQIQAVTEATSMIAIAYIGSDKEDSAEALWWARRAGALVPTLLGIAPEMLALPSDKPGV
jgi:hypothetical protein